MGLDCKELIINNKQAVIYARVSTREQQEGYSIDAQIKLLKEYAEKNNISIVNEFIDVESASKTGRQNFSKMVSYLIKESKKKNGCKNLTSRAKRNC